MSSDTVSIMYRYSIDTVSIQYRYCIDTVLIQCHYCIDTIWIQYRHSNVMNYGYSMDTVWIQYGYSIDTIWIQYGYSRICNYRCTYLSPGLGPPTTREYTRRVEAPTRVRHRATALPYGPSPLPPSVEGRAPCRPRGDRPARQCRRAVPPRRVPPPCRPRPVAAAMLARSERRASKNKTLERATSQQARRRKNGKVK